jgi:hypothetical protein
LTQAAPAFTREGRRRRDKSLIPLDQAPQVRPLEVFSGRFDPPLPKGSPAPLVIFGSPRNAPETRGKERFQCLPTAAPLSADAVARNRRQHPATPPHRSDWMTAHGIPIHLSVGGMWRVTYGQRKRHGFSVCSDSRKPVIRVSGRPFMEWTIPPKAESEGPPPTGARRWGNPVSVSPDRVGPRFQRRSQCGAASVSTFRCSTGRPGRAGWS